ncbi:MULTISPECIES: hypothetical protein [unclassified Saccharopolyspora]|uniref:hypothetical protein n=1 Tax=unclassified Saccharopolyspora TaxID=2646250 RepID=UPI001CD306A1|nr:MULTISPECIES: hypothetical protein [unclassified Saccharopolyspora]MCA1191954.1 hypothetical protein [Saccharopolyspora sp. 6V]MCA1224877.1 hypothetical protein [Saccharopolyspora sp. 6M]
MKAHVALKKLGRKADVMLESTSSLSNRASNRASKLDQDLIKKGRAPHARPRTLVPVQHGHHVELTPWQVLHTFARTVALAGQGSARAVAQHWDCLRYVTALDSTAQDEMQLSSNGNDLNYHRKGAQARDLGTAFGLAAAQQILREQFPGYRFDALDSELVLTAFCGSGTDRPAAGTSATRPNHLLVGRKPGAPVRVIAIDARGSHNKTDPTPTALAQSARRVHGLVLGESDLRGAPFPGLMTATWLRRDGIGIRLLAAEGNGVLTVPDPSVPAEDDAILPLITTTVNGERTQRQGFAVRDDRHDWLARLLLRTSAASLLTFAGNRAAARDLLTERQRTRLGTTASAAVPGMQGDARITLGGMPFVGTDQVFRLNGERVEVYSALLADQYQRLSDGLIDDHEAGIPAALAAWRRNAKKAHIEWGKTGLVHMDASGALLAIRPRIRNSKLLS